VQNEPGATFAVSLVLIEIHTGDYLGEQDIVCLRDDSGRLVAEQEPIESARGGCDKLNHLAPLSHEAIGGSTEIQTGWKQRRDSSGRRS
jgi:hypothetical protein